MQGVDDGLAEGQVVLGAGRHHRSPQRLRPCRLRLGRGGGRIGLGLRGGGGRLGGLGLGLGCFQRRLELGDDLGVYRSLGLGQSRVEGRLGLLSGGGGRVGLGLRLGGLGLGGGGLGFGGCRGGLGLGLGGIRGVVVAA